MSAANRTAQLPRLLSRAAKLATPATARLAATRASARQFTTARASSTPGLRVQQRYAKANRALRQYSSKSYPDHQVVGMPALSPTMTQGNVGQWQKNVGDKIEPGDVLVEIETDKAQMDFEFQEEGYLAKILAPTGTKDLSIDSPVAIIVEDEADVAAFADYTLDAAKSETKPAEPAAAPAAPAAQADSASNKPAAEAKQEQSGDRVFASPLAKTMAKEKGIDLKQVKGSGPRGRIVKADIESYVASGATAKAAAPAAEAPAAKTPAAKAPAAAPTAAPAAGFTDIPLTNMRKVIAERLT
ncbi:pyruvate dehydrogenase complex dihydrolipoamide acetyltransferase component (E2), partial [Coemansia brasiliensis]